MRIDQGVELSANNSVATLRFIGGPMLPATNPCFTDYAGWARLASDVLEVAVVKLEREPVDVSTPVACPAIGAARFVTVTLDQPFLGTIARDAPFGTDIEITQIESPELADCSFAGESGPHFAPELEQHLPHLVAGHELTSWSATGWCWVQLILGPEGVAQFLPIANSESLEVETMEYAQARRSGPDDPPNFIHAMRNPADHATADFARYLFFESVGVLHPETFDLIRLGSDTLGGKEVSVAVEELLEPSELERGRAYFYDTLDYFFAVISSDDAWAEDVVSQLP